MAPFWVSRFPLSASTTEPIKLQNFDFNTVRDPALRSNADPDPASKNKADLDPQPGFKPA